MAESLLDTFVHRTTHGASLLAYRWHDGRGWRDVSWGEHGRRTEAIATGLIHLGIERAQTVAIIGETRPEWTECDLAAQLAGAITVGIYQTSTPEQIRFILEDSGARLVFVDSAEQLKKLRMIREQIPQVQKVVVWDDIPGDDPDWILSLEEVLGIGRSRRQALATERDARREATRPDDPAILVYTSGTTGRPKGATLTHGNINALLEATAEAVPIGPDDLLISFLPMAHVAERVLAGYSRVARGSATAYARSVQTVMEDAQQTRPTVFGSVPRMFEKVYQRVLNGVASQPPTRQRLFHWALQLGKARARLAARNKPVPVWMDMAHSVADRLVFQRIRDVFGGRVRYFICGAAPISKEILEFFDAAGIPIYEVYGLTECTAICTANSRDARRMGSVGKPLRGVEVVLGEDGEVLVRGGIVFAGYWNNDESTADAIDPDGWLHTGDIGELDKDGFLRITDRKKNLIITAGGKNIAPANVENLLKGEPVISQAVVIGDRRKYLVALLTLDADEAEKLARDFGLEGRSMDELATHPRVREHLQRNVDRANRQLARYEQVKGFTVLPRDFSVAEGELTPTLKVKRRVVEDRYREEIEALYPPG